MSKFMKVNLKSFCAIRLSYKIRSTNFQLKTIQLFYVYMGICSKNYDKNWDRGNIECDAAIFKVWIACDQRKERSKT
jgi:hypothetical protein